MITSDIALIDSNILVQDLYLQSRPFHKIQRIRCTDSLIKSVSCRLVGNER